MEKYKYLTLTLISIVLGFAMTNITNTKVEAASPQPICVNENGHFEIIDDTGHVVYSDETQWNNVIHLPNNHGYRIRFWYPVYHTGVCTDSDPQENAVTFNEGLCYSVGLYTSCTDDNGGDFKLYYSNPPVNSDSDGIKINPFVGNGYDGNVVELDLSCYMDNKAVYTFMVESFTCGFSSFGNAWIKFSFGDYSYEDLSPSGDPYCSVSQINDPLDFDIHQYCGQNVTPTVTDTPTPTPTSTPGPTNTPTPVPTVPIETSPTPIAHNTFPDVALSTFIYANGQPTNQHVFTKETPITVFFVPTVNNNQQAYCVYAFIKDDNDDTNDYYNFDLDCQGADINGNLGTGLYKACSFAFSYTEYDESTGTITGSKFLGSRCVSYEIADKVNKPLPTQEAYNPDFSYTPPQNQTTSGSTTLPIENIGDKVTAKDIVNSTKQTLNDDKFFQAFLAKSSKDQTTQNSSTQTGNEESVVTDTVFIAITGAIITTAGILSYIAASLLKS